MFESFKKLRKLFSLSEMIATKKFQGKVISKSITTSSNNYEKEVFAKFSQISESKGK